PEPIATRSGGFRENGEYQPGAKSDSPRVGSKEVPENDWDRLRRMRGYGPGPGVPAGPRVGPHHQTRLGCREASPSSGVSYHSRHRVDQPAQLALGFKKGRARGPYRTDYVHRNSSRPMEPQSATPNLRRRT